MEQMEINDRVIVKDIINSTEKASQVEMDTGRILGLIPVFVLLLIMFIRLIFVIYKSNGQKTRSSQQRRPYIGSRQRPSDATSEPTVYVSPANLPPPPKYEAMAPPSYEEVVGIHYPNYQPPVQPITQPITTALAQGSTTNTTPTNATPTNTTTDNDNTGDNNSRRANHDAPPTVITVTTDERTTVTVAAS